MPPRDVARTAGGVALITACLEYAQHRGRPRIVEGKPFRRRALGVHLSQRGYHIDGNERIDQVGSASGDRFIAARALGGLVA